MSAPIADLRAHTRAPSGVAGLSHTFRPYVPYASTPIGRVIAVLTQKPPPMPGSRFTGPNPHMPPRPTQPDQMATAAGAAMTRRGQGRGAVAVVLWRPLRAECAGMSV